MTFELALGVWAVVTVFAIVSAAYLAAVFIASGALRLPRALDRRGGTARR